MRVTACIGLLGCFVASTSAASIATFDSFVEGDLGTSFVDGGITFFDFDDRAGGPYSFTCERADGTLSGEGFSPPNVLGFGSWVPGPDAAFQQCGSFSFTTGGLQTYAAIEVWEWLSPPGNRIWLEAYLDDVRVNHTSVVIPANGLINHWVLIVSGEPFDRLRVNATTGDDDDGIFIGLVDNVVVGCPADFNGDDHLNVFDFLAFQTAFGDEDPAADMNADGRLNVFDFLAFQTAFGTGC